ncbi:MAG: 3-hydroxy-3-methylglutaryl CoA synthase [Chloroflexi bacterium]|nr:3-hydroxy-3-methylglutaryl CoA synthase [Chloroflexota bacterium]
MSGITAIGAYIPWYRLPRQAFAQAWGSGGGAGERAVANHDEDTMTLAVNAVVDLLNASGREGIDAIYFASTTASYREKMSASLIAAAADFPATVRTADFGNSIRSGANALMAALDAVNAGSARSVLVVASDMRRGYPKSDQESTFGDAAAAFLIGKTNVAVEIVGHVSLSNEVADVWRRDADSFVRTWEDRFVVQHGYEEWTKKAVKALLDKTKVAPSQITKAVVYTPDARSHQGMVRTLGFDPAKQAQDPMIGTVGNTGAAHALLMLVAALEEAKNGDKILVASYGDGADAFLLQVHATPKKAKAVSGHLKYKKTLPSYDKMLAFRGILQTNPEQPLRVEPWAASTTSWRDQAETLRLHGSKCNKCGTVHHPIQKICYTCRAKDDFTEVRLYDKPGDIYSFTRDNLAGGLEPPTVNCVVESDEGKCRIFTMGTDLDAMSAKVGLRVEFTFRKMHEGAGFHNYYWKVRPIQS